MMWILNFKSNVFFPLESKANKLRFLSAKLSSDSISLNQPNPSMSLDLSAFKTITPAQFITFTVPNTIHFCCYLNAPLLRIAVLDSPLATADDDSPIIATIIVPEHRETDWNFCTHFGQLQLLLSFGNVSRLILIGNDLHPNPEPSVYIRAPALNSLDKQRIEDELKRLVTALHPKVCYRNGRPQPLYLTCEDDVLYRVVLERFVGPFVGEFIVEDVELESKEFRRRMRFKRTPNLIQSQVPLIPRFGDGECNLELNLESLRKMKEVEFLIDSRVLVQPYLTPMLCGIFLIVSPIDERIKQGFSPRALCLGVGGGSLLTFLNTQLGFEVVGVEADEIVLSAARKYFGFNDETSIKLIVGDAVELIEKFVHDSNVNVDGLNAKFDVVMVDLDANVARSGINAPPPEFVRLPFYPAMRSLLHDHGVLVINVVPPNISFYKALIHKLKVVFHKVYEIDVKNGGNFVLMATLTPIASNDHANAFLERFRSVTSGSYLDSIVEL